MKINTSIDQKGLAQMGPYFTIIIMEPLCTFTVALLQLQ